MVRASTKLDSPGVWRPRWPTRSAIRRHRCLASCGAAASFPVPPSGQPEMVPANAVFVPERTTLCPDHAGSTTTAKPNFAGQIAVTSCGGWPGSPDRDGVWVGRRRRKGQQAVSLTRSCAECARCSRSRSMLALRAWRWRFDRSALCQALFDFAVKLRAHSAQLRVKQATGIQAREREEQSWPRPAARASDGVDACRSPLRSPYSVFNCWHIEGEVDGPLATPVSPPPAAPPRNTSRWSPFLQLAVSRRPISATTWNTGCFGLEAVHGCPERPLVAGDAASVSVAQAGASPVLRL
jgi:hypothetical protein